MLAKAGRGVIRGVIREPVAVLAVLFVAVAVSEWLVQRTAARHLGTALLVIVVTALVAIEVPELCGAGLETLLNLLQGQSDHYRHIMVVGHNPTLESLGFYLTHEPIEKLPTCGIMHIPLSITSWDELSESCGTLERFDAPKMHYQYSPG